MYAAHPREYTQLRFVFLVKVDFTHTIHDYSTSGGTGQSKVSFTNTDQF